MHKPLRFAQKSIVVLTVIAVGACSDSTAPSPLIGSYFASSFMTTENGVTTDQLAAGASVDIALAADGTTTGELFIPASSTGGGGDFVRDLAGTWTQIRETVGFQHTADTFIRDMPFTIVGSTLVGDQTFGPTRVQLTLAKN
jgi:hypothetical protein